MKSLVIVALILTSYCCVATPTVACQMALYNLSVTVEKCAMLLDIFDAGLTDTQLGVVINGACTYNTTFENCTLYGYEAQLAEIHTLCTDADIQASLVESDLAFALLTFNVFCKKVGTQYCLYDYYHLYNDYDTYSGYVPQTELVTHCSECMWDLWDDSMIYSNVMTFYATVPIASVCMQDAADNYCTNYFFDAMNLIDDMNVSYFFPKICGSPCYNSMLTLYEPGFNYAHCHRNTSQNVPCYVTALQAIQSSNVINDCYPTQGASCLSSLDAYTKAAGCCSDVVLDMIPDETVKAMFASMLPERCAPEASSVVDWTFTLTIENLVASKIVWSTFKPLLLWDLMYISGLRNDSITITDPTTKRVETAITVKFTADSADHLTMIKASWNDKLNAGKIGLPSCNLDFTVREFSYTPLTVNVPTPPPASSTKHTTPGDSSAASHIAVGICAIIAAIASLF